MMIDEKKKEIITAIKIVTIINIAYYFISYLYVLITGSYNGDFLDNPTYLDFSSLSIILIISILPYLWLYGIFKYFIIKHPAKFIRIYQSIIEPVAIIIIIIHIFLAFAFGVGRAGGEEYSVPTIFKPLVQIMIRLSPVLWMYLLILMANKKKIIWYCLLIAILGISRASFGVVFSLWIVLFIRFSNEVKIFVRKHKILVSILVVIVFPLLVELGYTARTVLRGEYYSIEDSKGTLVFGKLIGRMSSFSNTAFIVENTPYFISQTRNIDGYFYQKQMLTAISQYFAPKDRPEKIIMSQIETPDTSSFILGTSGILIFSLYHSVGSFIINLLSIIIVDIIIFKLLLLLKNPIGSVLAYTMLLPNTLSGVGGEYFLTLVYVVFFVIIIAIINSIYNKLLYNKSKYVKIY